LIYGSLPVCVGMRFREYGAFPSRVRILTAFLDWLSLAAKNSRPGRPSYGSRCGTLKHLRSAGFFRAGYPSRHQEKPNPDDVRSSRHNLKSLPAQYGREPDLFFLPLPAIIDLVYGFGFEGGIQRRRVFKIRDRLFVESQMDAGDPPVEKRRSARLDIDRP